MRRDAAVGWLCLATLVLVFASYGAMALGGTESAGTLYGGENVTAVAAGVLSVMLAMLLIAASSGAEPPLRGVVVGCGSVTSSQIPGTALERSSCQDALGRQRAIAAILALAPAAVAVASVVVLARPPRSRETSPALSHRVWH